MAKRVMGVGAHPDDLEWYAGATIGKLARAGAEITFVVCTDGEKGSFDPDADARQIAIQRQAEQRDAANALGVREVIFLARPDGELVASEELRRQLTALYRKYQPELLLAFDPWTRYELHPDHIAAGRAALAAQHRALALHRSQTAVWDDAARAFIDKNARENGRHVGVEYAEAFRRIVIEGALIVAEGTRS